MERTFRVLVLDDEDYPRKKAIRELDDRADVKVVATDSLEAASAALAENFFDLAFVDLSLAGNGRGVDFLSHISLHAPSCPVVIVSAWTETLGPDVLSMIGGGAQILGIINKMDSKNWYSPHFAPLYKAWKQEGLEVTGVDGPGGVASALLEKRGQIDRDLGRSGLGLTLRTSENAVANEVYWLLRRVFGSTSLGHDRIAELAIPRIIRSGYSSSVVLEAVPTVPVDGLDRGVQGNRCIVKIGPTTEIATEIARYNQVVRFGVALEYRVEMLGSELGDALGIICYSFAGSRSTPELASLQDLLDGRETVGSWTATNVLTEMFDKSARNWYSIRGPVASLLDFYHEEYGVELQKCHDRFEETLRAMIEGAGIAQLADRNRDRAVKKFQKYWTFKVDDRYDFTIPAAQFMTSNGLRDETPGCLSHGDLHGGNIMIDPSQENVTFRFIDYRNAGLAPRLMDLCSLSASVRFAHLDALGIPDDKRPTAESVLKIVAASHAQERALIKGRGTSNESWVLHAAFLDGAGRSNFPDVTDEERLWSQFAHCISLFRIKELGWRRQVRLIVWLSALTETLVMLRFGQNPNAAVTAGDGATGAKPARQATSELASATADVEGTKSTTATGEKGDSRAGPTKSKAKSAGGDRRKGAGSKR